ncbi:MAG: GTPase ObgE [Spirochaetaceae bacterium]|nr:GTPase ObgE [Spirochaetaceae bacterium]
MIKFADEATIIVSSGKGGDGCIAFRREKYVPKGGPAGGDGGKGGDVIFVVKRNLRTLSYLRFKQTFKAQSGEPGMGRNMHGSDGADIIISVPPGTIIRDADSGELLMDFGRKSGGSGSQREGESWVFLKGGKGGLGNTHFKNSVNQAPRYASPGRPAIERRLKVELQLIADIGFVGFPNAGKSSLLDAFTNAHPKIAAYPFTTKIPNLGVMTTHERDIILADIPGIIEGAHEGAGLGIRFLRHIARTAILAYVIDISEPEWEREFSILRAELADYSAELAEKPHVIVATKTDLPEVRERLGAFRALLPSEKIYPVSVFTREGLDELMEAFFGLVTEQEKLISGEGPTIEGSDGSCVAEDFFDTNLPGFGEDSDMEAKQGPEGDKQE